MQISPTVVTIITLISTILGGGIGSLLTYKLNRRKQDVTDFSAIVAEYKKLVMAYKSEVELLRVEQAVFRNDLTEKEKEITQLRNQLMIFESSHTDLPVPIWLKDTRGIMLFVNQEYEKIILSPINKSAIDYIGKFDHDIWDKEVADLFIANDQKIMVSRKPEEVIESWAGLHGIEWEARVIKFPRFSGKTVIGIGGIMIDRWVKDKNLIEQTD